MIRLTKKQMKYYASKGGILLDLGSGAAKQKNFIGIDMRKVPGVDIVHDLEVIPYPVPDNCCLTVIASHILEHLKPWLTVDIFNEIWRIMKPGGQFLIAVPYAGSAAFWQDPTHCNGFNEITFTYFDPQLPLYDIYKPMPWKIIQNTWGVHGILEVVLEKLTLKDAEKMLAERYKKGSFIPGHKEQKIGVPVNKRKRHGK